MKNNEESLSEQLTEKEPPKAKKSSKEGSGKFKLGLPVVPLIAIRVALLLVVALLATVSVQGAAGKAARWIKQETTDISLAGVSPKSWLSVMEKGNYVLPLTLAQQNNKQDEKNFAPSEIFFPGNQNTYNSSMQNRALPQDFESPFNELIEKWQDGFASGSENPFPMDYYAEYKPVEGGAWIGNSELLGVLNQYRSLSGFDEAELLRKYAFYARIEFDAEGNLSIPDWYGLETQWRDRLLFDQLHHRALSQSADGILTKASGLFRSSPYTEQIRQPKNFTLVYALPRSYSFALPSIDHYRTAAMKEAGFGWICLFAVIGALLIGLLPLNRKPRLPLEFWLLGCAIPPIFYVEFATWSYDSGLLGYDFSEWMKAASALGIWLAILSFWCGLSWFLSEAVREGFGSAMSRGSLTVRFVRWLHAFDLADRGDRSLIRAAFAHFAVLAALVASAVFIRYYALIPLAVYLLALVYVAKKRKDRFRYAYDRFYGSVQEIAGGNFEIGLDDRLGPFDPLKNELRRIREGFKRAVDEETKSQKMKSELVTNVSHDLKTPVTAILTYVNLLQQADLTEEERRAYIDVLSGKSQRLSRLIEDLFEYTRASSGSAEVAPVSVDLVELLKQAHIELEDRMAESNVQLRFVLPEHKVILPLDSEKTFRIFENLYLNIAKYSMPGSRAYVELTEDASGATVSFKNVSAAELDFKPEEITERFVRGDRSRHTEGSGLGLAIVKSLVELQGGAFAVELDGDLFKAVIRWPKPAGAEGAGDLAAASGSES
ncbi:sensor histidine kinase [Saccharibacillus alkalitolerans]|uniref:histidine kinase n=1 Tax=Saccharibacillus alkalitolerans TaxID=2705290 RepID=A0ABX0F346_9BACL|nr:HAMP domain-containing sensor histidine kinase [Saccharibacillus alkalitolerans]NGZ74788.1 HAMP domain-containing histidine kinase [Saccharibacillus alkalitolerans]